MVQFLVKRFIGLFFVVICVTFITFTLGYLAPGDPIQGMLGQRFNQVAYNQLRELYGLNKPFYVQYFDFVTGVLRLDFGYSYNYQGRSVWSMVATGLPTSAELALWGLLASYSIGIPVGVFSALKANTWIDTTSMTLALVLYALPTFILAVLFQVVVVWINRSTGLQWPVANWGNPWHYTLEDIQFKLGPVLVYAALTFASIARYARTSVLDVLSLDYVRTARAKGLRERVVINRHALRNALLPIITLFGISLGSLITGIFFIEQIFNIPGLGSATIYAISERDYPVIQATALLGATAVVLGNLVSDLLYTIVDPRIKAE